MAPRNSCITVLAESPEHVVEQARRLVNDRHKRGPGGTAHYWVQRDGASAWPQRLWLYQMLWRKRRAIDCLTQQRFAGTSLALPGEMML